MKFWEGAIVFGAGLAIGAALATRELLKFAKNDKRIYDVVCDEITTKVRGTAAELIYDTLKPKDK